MAALILPHRWISQPQYPVGIDRGNVFAQKTIYLATPNTGVLLLNAVRNTTIVLPGSVIHDDNSIVATFSGAQQANQAFALPPGATLDNIVVAARVKATAAQAGNPGAAFGLYASGGQTGVGVGFDTANAVGAAYIDNNGAGLAAKSSGALNTWYTVYVQAQTVGDKRCNAWINGAPATTQSVQWAPIATVDEIAIGAQHRSAGFLRNFTGRVQWMALLHYPGPTGQFNFFDSDAAALYRSGYPWSAFAPIRRRIWMPSAAAPPPGTFQAAWARQQSRLIGAGVR